jgi:hypothetical protein
MGNGKKLYNEQIYNILSSQHVIKAIKSMHGGKEKCTQNLCGET